MTKNPWDEDWSAEATGGAAKTVNPWDVNWEEEAKAPPPVKKAATSVPAKSGSVTAAKPKPASEMGWGEWALDTVKKLPAAGKAALLSLPAQGARISQGIVDFNDTITYPIDAAIATLGNATGAFNYDPDARADFNRQYWGNAAKREQSTLEAARPKAEGLLQQGIFGGIESTISSAPAMLAGMMTGSPAVTLSMMGAQTGIPKYAEAREANKDFLTSIKYGVEQGGIEVLTEKMPVSKLLSDVAMKSPFGRTFMRNLMEEIPNEQAATFLQDLSEWATMNPEKSVSDFLHERPSAAAQTLIATVTQSGLQTGIVHGASKAADKAAAQADRVITARQERRAAIQTEAATRAQQSITPQDHASPLDTADIAAGRAATFEGELDKKTPLAPTPVNPWEADWSGMEADPRTDLAPALPAAPIPRAAPHPTAAPATFDRLVQITMNRESAGGKRYGKNGKLLEGPQTKYGTAKGEMQVLDGTMKDPGFGVRPAQNDSPEERARVGRDYLAMLMKRYNGDPAKTWAAYNWGPGNLENAVKKHGEGWLDHAPAETRKYVMRSLSELGSFTPEGGVAPVTDVDFDEVTTRPAPSPLEFMQQVLGNETPAKAEEGPTGDPIAAEMAQARAAEAEPAQQAQEFKDDHTETGDSIAALQAFDQLEKAGVKVDADLVNRIEGAVSAARVAKGGFSTSMKDFVKSELESVQSSAASTVGGDVTATPQASLAPINAARIEPTASGKGVAVFDATPEELAAINAALPEKASGMTRADGSVTYSKKHETKIRDALNVHQALSSATVGGRPLAEAAAAARGATEGRMKVEAGPAARQGSLGMMLEAGEQVRTSSGRTTTAFPKIATDTDRKTGNTVRNVDKWLLENAALEAEARGDDFNAPVFRRALENPKNISQADKDSAEEYLFGDQPDVVPSVLKDISPRSERQSKPDQEAKEPEGSQEAATPADPTVKENATVAQPYQETGGESTSPKTAPEHANANPDAPIPAPYEPAATGESTVQGNEPLFPITEEGIEAVDLTESQWNEITDEWGELFSDPKGGTVRLADKAKAEPTLTVEQAAARVAQWQAHIDQQGEQSAAMDWNDPMNNRNKVVLSLFDLSGEWARPWQEAGYDVRVLDIQRDEDEDISLLSAEWFQENMPDVSEIYAILAACPCTDFASSGARHFAAKDEDGRTAASVELVHQTLRTIEYWRPAVWAIENPVGRIEKMGGLPKASVIFDPAHVGAPYTKKTILWGKMHADRMPIAPVEPTEGSKMHRLYGGKSLATKNARSATPEGFALSFFMANNHNDLPPEVRLTDQYPEVSGAIKMALKAGLTESHIRAVVEDPYGNDEFSEARQALLRDASAAARPAQETKPAATRREADKKNPNPFVRKGEQWTVSKDVDYLSANAVYEIESTDKRSAYFKNVARTGSGTSLNNYAIEKAMRDGVMTRVGVSAAPVADVTPATKPVAVGNPKPAPARKTAKSQAKPLSLIEWIAAQGGLWDGNKDGSGFKGGDAKAMGLNQWHLKRPFRRKAVRDAAQGAGENGPDTLLRKAVDAGYFPELEGRDESRYDNLLDTKGLYDAIEQELRGRPRYSTYDSAALEGQKDASADRPMDQEELETARVWLTDAAGKIGIPREDIDNDFLDYAAQVHWDSRGTMSEEQAVEQAVTDYTQMNREDAGEQLAQLGYEEGEYVDPFADENFNRSRSAAGDSAGRSPFPDDAPTRGNRSEDAGSDRGPPAEQDGQETPSLDRGAAVDPAIAARQRQQAQLGADAPLQGASRTGQAQDGEMGLALFDNVDQPQMDLSAPRPAPQASPNKIVTDERAAELRARLREKLNPGRLNSGIDPEILTIGAELAIYHVEKGARRFTALAQAIAADLGMGVRDVRRYLRGWYNGARDMMEDHGESVAGMDTPDEVAKAMRTLDDWADQQAATPAEIASPQNTANPENTAKTPAMDRLSPLQAAFAQHFGENGSFKSITEARAFAKAQTGQEFAAGTPEAKQLDEAIEAGVVFAARQIAAKGQGFSATYDALVDLYQRQPKLGVRTSTSVTQQAYSTPVPLAYAASTLAGIDQNTSVYEPSAGNGALLIDARATYVTANELNPDRAAQLRSLFPGAKVSTADATEFTPPQPVDAVIANPPFGPVKDDAGESVVFDVDGQYKTKEIDHAIAMKALDAMKDGGKAVLIVGGPNKLISDPKKRADAYNGKAKREFYYKLYTQYNVTDHFTVDGALYEKQGAGWPVDVIVIDGRGQSRLNLPAVKAPRQIADWAQLKEAIHVAGTEVSREAGQQGGIAAETELRAANRDEGNLGEGGSRRDTGRDRSDQDRDSGSVRGGPVDGQPAGVRLGEERNGVAEPAQDNQPARPVRRDPVEGEGENARQVAYRPGSNAAPMDTLVPVNMGSAIDEALSDLAERRGSIDGFVSDRLGYDPADLSKFFGAEQVDAIALAIDNLENGAGFIIGDQTGIGKGRQVAALIRYAIIQGRNPVFVTEKPNLYRDMYRDLVDIGLPDMLGRDINVVMTNTGEKVPLNEEGTEVLSSGTPAKHNALLEKLAANGNLKADGVDALFTTYAQMQTVRGDETVRQRVIESLARGGIVVFDESHNAGGQGAQMFEAKNAPRSRAKFARDLVKAAHGVVYSSATYAKRPDVMDLYSATDMKLAVPEIEKLGEVITKGGVPMQQVVAAMLSRAGQYVRRERSFDGITYATPTVEIETEKYSRACEILAAIQDFSENHVSFATKEIDEKLRAEGKTVNSDNATGKPGASSTNFTAIMHNAIDQMLLAFKADAAADRAIAAAQAGEKPVITVANTLESFLTQMAEDSSKSVGDIFDVSFGDVFRRYLERSRIITVKKPFAEKGEKGEKVRLTDEQLGGAGAQAFRNAMGLINEAGLDDLPGSPIDHIISRIEQAGFTVGEITGRNLGLEYREGQSFLKSRPQAERSIKGRIQAIERFNNGDVDVMLLNRSGSTGLSLHASERFKDQRPRKMIIAQAEGNIDTHMQMLGRVHRTGQVVLPSYDQLVAGVPAEKRPAAVLAKKMASLNANTTAARDSALTSSEVLDFMNEYGDEVVARIMQDDIETHARLGLPLNEDDGYLSRDGAARKVTGRIPLLPVQMQEDLYALIESEYTALLEQKDAAGENALEAKTFDLDAKPLEKAEAIPPANSKSPFADGVYVERFDIKSTSKPFTTDEVREQIKEGLEEQRSAQDVLANGREYARDSIDLIKDEKARERARDKSVVEIQTFSRISAVASAGEAIRMKTDNGNYYGVVTDIFRKGKTRNPLALGSWKMTIAMLNGNARSMTIPYSQIDTQGDPTLDTMIIEKADKIEGTAIIDMFDKSQGNLREQRSIVTGNLLAGFDYVDGKGTIINFTTSDGEVKQGIMLARGFNFEKHHKARPVVLTDPNVILTLIDQTPKLVMTGKGGNGDISVVSTYGNYTFATARSKAAGGEFFTSSSLTGALGRDFVSSSQGMTAKVERDKALAALDVLIKGGVKFELGKSVSEETKQAARDLSDAARGRQSRIVPGAPPMAQTDGPVSNEAVRAELKEQLDKMKLGDKLTLKVVDLLFSDVGNGKQVIGGDYLDGVIRVASQAETDGRYTLDHEVIHGLKDLGMFKQDEWRALERAVMNDADLMGRIADIYPDLDRVGQVEEAVAELFAAWRANRRQASGFVRDALRRVADFFDAMRKAVTRTPSVRSTFRAIEKGDIGQREPTMGDTLFNDGNPDVNPQAKQQRTAAADVFLSSDKSQMGELLDTWRTKMQDKMLPLLRTQARLEAQTGNALPERMNPYLQEELMSGRVGAEIEDFTENHVNPLFEAMAAEGVTVEEVETYLYARHAPERNARISSINEAFEEGTGSGMTDAEAAAIMAQVEASGKQDALDRVAERVDALLTYALDRRVESGLLSEEEAETWRETYEHYVPLRGEGELEPEKSDQRPRFGSGINVRGKESKMAFGRRSRANDILAYAIMQGEEAIMRAGRNEVAKSFFDMARTAKDETFWKTTKVTRVPYFNKGTGTVGYRNQTQIDPADEKYTITAKIEGQERRVTLNRHNPTAVKLAESMRNLNAPEMGAVLNVMSKVNRYLSTINTAFNPEFLVTNALRDMQTAAVNLLAEDKKGLINGVRKDYLRAMASVWRGERGTADQASREWDRWYDEFRHEGGRVYFNNTEDLNDIKARINQKVSRLMQTNGRGDQMKEITEDVFKFIDAGNTAVENAIRLATYKNARERGMTKAEAASLAKNLTVNFNRRGAWGTTLNSLYLFYNASVQGSARIITSLQNKKVRRFAYAAIATGFALDMLNAMLSGRDDDDELYYNKISDYDKSRNLIIMTGGSSYLKIPLPYGYNVFYAMGRVPAEISRGKRWEESAGNLVSAIADAFNPIGGTESILNFVSPTISDPFVDLYRNRDFADRPIMPDQNQFGPEEPDNQRYWSSVSPVWKAVTDTLNTVTGGDDVVPGAVDVSPETLEHLFGYVTGAAGAFFADRVIGTGVKALTGEDIEANDLPFVRKVVGDKPGWYDKSIFYARADEVEQAADRLKKYEEYGDDDKADAFSETNADLLGISEDLKVAKKGLRAVRKQRGEIDLQVKLGDMTNAEAREERDALKAEEAEYVTAFNTIYLETVANPKR